MPGLEREVGTKVCSLSSGRMTNSQGMGVQQKPRCRRGISVERVTKYWVAEFFQVNPQLV